MIDLGTISENLRIAIISTITSVAVVVIAARLNKRDTLWLEQRREYNEVADDVRVRLLMQRKGATASQFALSGADFLRLRDVQSSDNLSGFDAAVEHYKKTKSRRKKLTNGLTAPLFDDELIAAIDSLLAFTERQ
ncbi:MAG: hypothetical protein LBI35_09425 [Burkholderiales bacterium]|jgi:hypothetical protein|nr:hypothetical protein [Burkholderiales bacterium]